MLSFDERKKHVSLKLLRAKEHLKGLELEIQDFFKTQPFKVGVKIDRETRKPTYFVESTTPVPDQISVIAGDLIQNLVTALDHLAYQLVCKDTNDSPPKPNTIYFPIAGDLDKYNENKRRKMNGASEETINAIDALKPYKGGDDLIWSLHALNNIEKHRLLLTVGSHAAGIHLGQLMSQHLGDHFPDGAKAALESMNHFLMPADKGFPLTADFELYTGAVDEQPNPKLEFRFNVALSEPGIIDGKPLFDTVNNFSTMVQEVVETLMPLLE
jgi:hypothetical protein